MIDIAVIGGGPAGLSAAVNGAIRNKKAIVFGRHRSSGPLYRAERVDNYLGMPALSGREMVDAYYSHAAHMQIEIKEGRVLQILPMGTHFVVNFENDFYDAKTIVIATGAAKKGSSTPGEDEYLGRGVSYCATCDGMLYRGKTALVASETSEGEEDANFLAEVCNNVFYLPKYSPVGSLSASVEVINSTIMGVLGDNFVTGVELDDGKKLDCDGVFFVKEVTPVHVLIHGLELEEGSIAVNRHMETNIPGVFAAGDCIGWPLQVANAVGEGLVAAQQAVRYLNKGGK